MTHREPRDDALSRDALIKAFLIGKLGDNLDTLIDSAVQEAYEEVKAKLKLWLMEAILDRTAQRAVVPAETIGEPPTDGEAAVLAEMEAIRRKITENEAKMARAVRPAQREGDNTRAVAPPACAPDADAADSRGFYVYGVLRASDPCAAVGEPGMGSEDAVTLLTEGDLAAIVSELSTAEYEAEALEANVNDPQWLQDKALRHQDVLTKAMRDCAIIPMRFCTIYRTVDGVLQMLRKHATAFHSALDLVDDKQEWGVKVYYDPEILGAHVGELSGEVARMQAQVAEKTSGAAYFLEKRIEVLRNEEAERLSDEMAQRFHDGLCACAHSAMVSSLQSEQGSGRSEPMVLNGAYLVDIDALPQFRAALKRLSDEYGHLGFDCELTGPWPPYNFISIVDEEG
jgi:hypothetical protein